MGTISLPQKNINGPSYLVFFDLDRTLAKSVSGKALAQTAFRKGLLKGRKLFKAIFSLIAFISGTGSQIGIINNMIGWVGGISEKDLETLCSEVFRDTVQPAIHNEARPEIISHKIQGARVVVLSSSLEPLCSMVAEYLNMDDFICTRLEAVNGIYTGRPAGTPCFGPGKVTAMKVYCEKNNSNPEDAWYYGDSESDIPVLSSVGHPVCINPDGRLRKKANEKKWPIYEWS